MIYCPKCGTANRDGSRFCNECGQRLGAHTRVRCPQCGTFNSIKNVFCDNCSGRLLPAHSEAAASDAAVPIKGLSLPTKGPVSSDIDDAEDDVPDEDENVPGWLRELGSSWSSQDAADPLPEEGNEIPDWLKDLRESLPDDQEVDATSEEAEKVPDWLAGMQSPSSREDEPESEYVSDESEYVSDDVPEWLADLRGTGTVIEPAPQAPAMPDLPSEDAPDWLAELRSGGAGGPQEEAGEPEQPSEELPDWLAELRAGGARGGQEEAAAPAGDEAGEAEYASGDLPDWLAGLRGGEDEEQQAVEPEVAPALEEDEVPDWLAELRGGEDEEQQAVEPEAAPALEEDEVPDWLAGLRGGEDEEQQAVEPEAAPTLQEGEVPDWLAALRPAAEDEPQVPPRPKPRPPQREAAATEQMPDWLAAMRPPGVEGPEPDEFELEPEQAGGEPEPEERAGDVPGWLGELGISSRRAERDAEEDEPEYRPGGIPDWLVPTEGGLEEETLARAEIPEWLLALKPAALRAEGEPEGPSVTIEEPVEETGILAGLQGTLSVEMLIAQPRTSKTPSAVAAPVVDTPSARLFAEIVGRPAESAPKEIVRPRRRLLSLLPRWLMYIALIGVVTLPLVAGRPIVSRHLEAGSAVVALHDQIANLDEDSVVLVAFDYDPTSSGEMDLLARALVGSVMDHGARIIAVSTLPAGPGTAQLVLDDLAAERPLYADGYGERYANLGYIAGQAAGVRLLSQSLPLALVRDFYATPLGELQALGDVMSAADLDLVVELAATQETLRWWIEQAGAPYGIPIAAGTSGAVEPFARAYYRAAPPQLIGVVSGVPGAASYKALASGQTAPDDPLADPSTSWEGRLDSQLGGHLVLIVVLLLGGVVGLLRRNTGREA